ncbi:MAG: TonB-dependent receptor [Gemmatimonadaceae bacterium]
MLAAVAAALPAVLAAQPSSGTITGRVTSAGGAALPGATVSVAGTSRMATARADGAYRLVVPAGSYVVVTRLVGYQSVTRTVTVAAGGAVSADFVLERSATTLDAVAIVGTRGEARTVIDAPVPIDVLNAADLSLTGRTETAQMLQAAAPSVNFPRTSIGDGTDHVRPATLRGLAPDQTLVLVNGKRRHTSALVNVNGFVGRGSTMVDLNAIPASMIERIEILRDGAAAQYGSDAIAGVINIVLKSDATNNLTTTFGQSNTELEGVGRMSDGKVFQAALNGGVALGEAGFLHAGLELRDRGATNRSLRDPRPQYFRGDPRESDPNLPVPGRLNHRQGDASTHDLQGFLNAGTTLADGVELYAFGGVGVRRGEAAGFFRRPNDDRTVRAIYPNGFLPIIASDIFDGSLAAGARGSLAGWKWDLSNTYGRNTFGFDVKHSVNVSMGTASPTQFYAGTMGFGQNTVNLDLFRQVGIGLKAPMRLALGGEFRRDGFWILKGDTASRTNGGVKILDGPNAGKNAAPYSQVFPGFSTRNEQDRSRTNAAGYVDLESDLTPTLLLGVAGRAERYSDFGSTTNGKVSLRFEPVRAWALRGAASTGFRAPALAQQFFSSTATNFVGGIPYDILTVPVESDIARLFGSKALKPEQSTNLSGGVAIEPFKALSLTVDAYRIDIRDRIVFSENFTQAQVVNRIQQAGFTGITGIRFFTNAIDTRTEGLDIVANWGTRLSADQVLRLSSAFNANRTRVTRVSPTPPELAGLEAVLFGRVERTRIERGQPRNNMVLTAGYDGGPLGLNVHAQRYGEVTSYGTPADGSLDQTFSAKWITDASASYRLWRQLTVTAGADNLFDVYPDRNSVGSATVGGNSNFGIFPYNGISPFGFNGRFIYVRVGYGF